MALLWIDSFDGYNASNASQGYDLGATGSILPGGGRGGGGCIEISGTGFVKRIPSVSTVIMGYACRFGDPTGHFSLDNGTNNMLSFSVNGLGNVVGSNQNGSLFSTAPGMRLFDVWRYYEHKLKVASGTSGTYELRVDDQTVVSLSGINTMPTGAVIPTIERVAFGGFLGTVVDDLYIADTSLGPNAPTFPDNDFLGDLRMMNIHPNGPVETAWTPHSLPDNWDEVNDINTDNAATYVQTGTVTNKDVYDYEDPNLPPGTVIVAVATMTSAARLNTSGPRQLTAYIRGGIDTATATTEVSGGIHQLSDSYYMEQFLRAQNPATGTRWTASEVDKIRAGFALTE